MNYPEAIEYLYSHLPLFHRIGPAAYKADLKNTLALDTHFNSPHRLFKTIHIAGTNGKGSVSHMIAAVLQTAGYRTGLFTSPHLVDFRERIRINGQMVPEDYIVGFVEANQKLIERIEPSFFELTTLMAFQYFAREGVEIAVIETGMGGRLDSTNIITPVLSVITNIGLDHTQFLGPTLELIAGEKAGIIKQGVPVVIGENQKETRNVFLNTAYERGSEIHFASENFMIDSCENISVINLRMNVSHGESIKYPDLEIDLTGNYQKKNILTVLQALSILDKTGIPLSKEVIYPGLKNAARLTGLRGRWEEICRNPRIICDTGHNAEGLKEVFKQIRDLKWTRLHIVFGMVSDKDPEPVLLLLPADGIYYFTRADIPRALDPGSLQKRAEQFGLKGNPFPSVIKAYDAALKDASTDDLIFIGGSTFVVGELLKELQS